MAQSNKQTVRAVGDTAVSDSVIQRMKIAVALACLRNKPAGVSGRDYVQQLCDSFKANQLQWKHKHDEAQAEILYLKQQLALQPHQQVIHDVSMPSSSQSIFPTPPASYQASSEMGTNQDKFATQTAFLYHMISIQTASSTNTDELASLDNLAVKSVLHSLELLQMHLGKNDYSWRIQMQCTEYIGILMDKANNKTRAMFVEKVCTICQQIITEIMLHQSLSTDIQVKQVKLLSNFSVQQHLTKPVLQLLCESVHKFSEHLRAVTRTEQDHDPHSFYNVYYIIVAIDNCLSGQHVNEWDEEFKDYLRVRLEDCLLHLTEQFPLFAHAIWKLCAKIP